MAVRVGEWSAAYDVWDGAKLRRIKSSEWLDVWLAAIDKSSLVTFGVFETPEAAVWPPDASRVDLEILLDLQAGARNDSGEIDVESHDEFVHDVTGDDGSSAAEDNLDGPGDRRIDEGVVNVGDALLRQLKREVDGTLKLLQKRVASTSRRAIRCQLCPFRTFRGGGSRARCISHTKRYHREEVQFCCSGTKQIKVIAALHDDDKLREVSGGGGGRKPQQRP